MKCSDSDRETLERIYQGSKLASNRRRISPNTKAIYEILARRTKEALNDNRTNYDRAAAIRDIDEIRAINTYVQRREVDKVLLENDGYLARLVDYAMVFCESLKAIEGTKFRHMFWIDIVDQLDQELAIRQQWHGLNRDDANEAELTLYNELKDAIKQVGESDFDQGLWEIRLYAKRNGLMHNGILDRRLRGEYDAVAKIIDSDLASLTQILPEEELNKIPRYRKMLTRFRRKWFDPVSVDERGQPIWELNAAAEEHLAQLKKKETAHHPPETEEEKMRESIAALTEEIRILKEALGHNTALTGETKSIALASLHLAAEAVPKPNTPQKKPLEGHDVYIPNSKRRRIEGSEAENRADLGVFDKMNMD